MASMRWRTVITRASNETARSFSSSAESGAKVSVLSGIPEKHAVRRVRIYKPAK